MHHGVRRIGDELFPKDRQPLALAFLYIPVRDADRQAEFLPQYFPGNTRLGRLAPVKLLQRSFHLVFIAPHPLRRHEIVAGLQHSAGSGQLTDRRLYFLPVRVPGETNPFFSRRWFLGQFQQFEHHARRIVFLQSLQQPLQPGVPFMTGNCGAEQSDPAHQILRRIPPDQAFVAATAGDRLLQMQTHKLR